MYYRGKNSNVVPFEIECTNCRSHDVDVHTTRRNELEIKCNKCGSYVNTDSYNELTCNKSEGRNIGCGLITTVIAVIVVVVIVMVL